MALANFRASSIGRYGFITLVLCAFSASGLKGADTHAEPAPIEYHGANPNERVQLASAPIKSVIATHRSSRNHKTQSNAQKVSYRTSKTNVHAQPVPNGFAKQKIGSPYQIAGKWYVPFAEPDYDEVGIGSWYGPNFHGTPSATGEIFDQNALTAAHPTLPIPSLARVTNLENGRTVVVRINDRGPFVDDRIIDLSKHAARALDYQSNGTAKVRVQYIGLAPEGHNSVPYEHQAHADRLAGVPSSPKPKKVSSRQKDRPHKALYGHLALQVGAFADIKNANMARASLSIFGPSKIVEAESNGQKVYRVFVGEFSNVDEARRLQYKLQRTGKRSIVVSTK